MYDNKIAIVIKDELLTWQKLNVTAFLASAVAIKLPETHGGALISGSGTTYLPFMKQPVLIYKADTTEQIKRAFNRAKDRNLQIGVYTNPHFATKTEDENIAEMARHTDNNLDLVGIIVYGPNKMVDKTLDGLKFHS
ncbi:DUF2000 domain-containing protein [Mucilaginibacter sp. FT3.2]|uniref:DUF2000 domain-containing protein n=1 Tax=Mucilaginibacter sp. FT3.2 TaxID=2723090 RepID=UPI001614BE5B|nr:DUF2000 domain-containing protein [Mucilaginibacter sp. FT3.2]MBB6232507.1 hypothetical protein [Mucilaginibacter sp. FT3.2]